jgi:hydrogenase maturation protease
MPKRGSSGEAWKRALDREIARASRIVVLGIGHAGKADDGAGPFCLYLLEKKRSSPARAGLAKKLAPSGPNPARAGLAKKLAPSGTGLAVRLAPSGTGLAVRLVHGGETPEAATGEVRAFRPDLTILVDAALGGRPPGTVFLVTAGEIADDDMTTHHIPLSHLVRYLEESIGSRTFFLGIEPDILTLGAAMSDPVKSAVEALAKDLAARLFR